MKNKIKLISYLLVATLIPAISLADTIVHNVQGYTSTTNGIHAFTTLVFDDNGKIVSTGGDALRSEHADARQIDGGGKFMLPGLTDAHAHLYSQGFLTISLNLAGSPSLADSLQQIDAFASENPRTAWILGRGWNQVLWPVKEFPKASDIDPIVNDRPLWLRRIDGHAGWANSKALAIAGIDDDTADPIGGKIVRDDHGNATGILIDKAMGLIDQHVPAPTKDDIREAYLNAVESLVPLGMTGMHDAGISITEAEVLISMADNNELNMRVYAMLSDSGANLDAMGEPLKAYGKDRLDIQAVKLYSDGALGSRGAAMIEPYSDDVENRGLPFYTQDELDGFVQKSNDMGFQVAIHAIGDLGNRMALDAFEKAQGGKVSPLRNRIEHSQIISLDDIPRFAKLGVIAAMQPIHATSDMNMAEDRIGSERIKGGYAWRRLLDSGAIIAGGSDFPVELPSPFLGLYAAVTRQNGAGLPEGGWYMDQALTRAEVLHAFTLDAAYAAHQEDRLGSLEAGKWADFIIVDRDYFECPAAEIDDIQVLQTWVGGQRVFNAAE